MSRKLKRIYKERKVYFFTCSHCGRVNRQSYHLGARNKGICRSCKRFAMDLNQQVLFQDVGQTTDRVAKQYPSLVKLVGGKGVIRNTIERLNGNR